MYLYRGLGDKFVQIRLGDVCMHVGTSVCLHLQFCFVHTGEAFRVLGMYCAVEEGFNDKGLI